MCEWWYNVLCENSEKLYDKNVELYTNPKQNEDMSNDQKNDNDRDIEYSKSWNYHNNPNDNHNSNNDNYATHHRHRKHHHSHHNHRPHSHYSGNEFEANSNRQELLSKAPTPMTGGSIVSPISAPMSTQMSAPKNTAEIDIDLSNDESRQRGVQTVADSANEHIVSKPDANNRSKNIVFFT